MLRKYKINVETSKIVSLQFDVHIRTSSGVNFGWLKLTSVFIFQSSYERL